MPSHKVSASGVLLRTLAGLFAAIAIMYGAAWMYYVRFQTAGAQLGFDCHYSASDQAAIVDSVEEGGPAAQAGLEARDRIVSVDGAPLDSPDNFEAWAHSRAPDVMVLTVERQGLAAPLRLSPRLLDRVPFSLTGILHGSLLQLFAFYPVVFLIVGLTVLVLRVDNPHAWLMAALFAGFVAIPEFPQSVSEVPRTLATFVRAYRAIGLTAIPALFYVFFAVFPARSPLDRKVPWLKWLFVAGWLTYALPGLRAGGPQSPGLLAGWLGPELSAAIRLGYLYSGMPLGFLSLTLNMVAAPTSDTRRKAHVIFWGTVVGVVPILVQSSADRLAGWYVPTWLQTATILMVFVFPLSFAYAVVRYRVLDIPVLLKQSARYVLVRRGFAVLILVLAATITAVFTLSFSRLFDVDVNLAMAVGVAFGVVLSFGSAPLVRRATTRIDRAFFRSAYDATAILENLADNIRQVTSRRTLAALLEKNIAEALLPLSLSIFLEDTDGKLHSFAAERPLAMPALSPDLPWLQELARRGRPLDVSAAREEIPQFLRDSHAECVVPIVGRTGRLTGYLVLGPRASEEPYSRDDKRLLASVANQAGIELENIRLAETIAERLDAERAATRELEIARQVQFRLFPQKQPLLHTLEYAGRCLQAHRVGGDYYDFVELGAGRLGLVVADISGKGIAGALLMANLQANLRSQYALASDDLPRLLKTVNQLFFDNTAENQYATLFFADYSDATRRLRYANCGHFPPFLIRADGTVDRLMPTAMVLGLFEAWSADTCERELHPGDTLVIYTDGVIEAQNAKEEEFGTERLLAVVHDNRHLPADALVTAIHAAVLQFSQGNQWDDLTVVVAMVR